MATSTLSRKRRVGTVSSQVLDYIRDGILSGQFPAGFRLDQQAIAEELGVSIIPVRESLRQLEAEGLVQSQPYRGSYVAELSLADLRDIYITRETLEALAAQLAVSHMTAETLRLLEALFSQMEQATDAMDLNALFELNRSFHFTIYTSSQNGILVQLIESLWDRSTVYRRIYTFMPERAPLALEEHKRILKACQDRDPVAAGQAVRENVSQTTRAIIARSEKERNEAVDDETSRDGISN